VSLALSEFSLGLIHPSEYKRIVESILIDLFDQRSAEYFSLFYDNGGLTKKEIKLPDNTPK